MMESRTPPKKKKFARSLRKGVAKITGMRNFFTAKEKVARADSEKKQLETLRKVAATPARPPSTTTRPSVVDAEPLPPRNSTLVDVVGAELPPEGAVVDAEPVQPPPAANGYQVAAAEPLPTPGERDYNTKLNEFPPAPAKRDYDEDPSMKKVREDSLAAPALAKRDYDEDPSMKKIREDALAAPAVAKRDYDGDEVKVAMDDDGVAVAAPIAVVAPAVAKRDYIEDDDPSMKKVREDALVAPAVAKRDYDQGEEKIPTEKAAVVVADPVAVVAPEVATRDYVEDDDPSAKKIMQDAAVAAAPVVAKRDYDDDAMKKEAKLVDGEVLSKKQKIEKAEALVIDSGSHTTRAGPAGIAEPEMELLSITGTRKLTMGGDGMLPDEAFGADADRASTAYDLTRPIQGVVTDWDAAEKLWCHALFSLEQTSEKVIVTTSVMCPKALKERMVTMCLDQLGFEQVHCGVAAVLALFGAGYTTGVVVDCGYDSSRVVPVYESFALPHAIVIDTALGGTAIDARAARLLEGKGIAFRNAQSGLLAGEACKLQCATLECDESITIKLPARRLSKNSRDEPVDMSIEERLELGECMFVPQVANRSTESPGLAGIVHKSINACSIDLRRELYEGVMVVGGGSVIHGLPERLEKDLRHLAPEGVTVAVTAYENRQYAAFAGASMVATLPEFATNWISKDDTLDSRALELRLEQTSYGC